MDIINKHQTIVKKVKTKEKPNKKWTNEEIYKILEFIRREQNFEVNIFVYIVEYCVCKCIKTNNCNFF